MTDDEISSALKFQSSLVEHFPHDQLHEVVYADPGRNAFYYREKMPDSVAAYLRTDIVDRLIAEARAEGVAEGTERAASVAENLRLNDIYAGGAAFVAAAIRAGDA